MRHKSLISSNSKSKLMNGFTIVELLVVITVIAILATVTIISYGGWRQSIAETEVVSDLNGAVSAMDNARNWGDGYPTSIPATFKPSPNVTLSYNSGDATNYCIDAASKANTNVTYYVDSSIGKTPQKGSCSVRPKTCPTGYIVVPGSSTYGTSDFCVMKYEAKNTNGAATSQATGAPWVNITQTDAITAAASICSACHLITEAEWMTIAQNVLGVASNWSGGAVGSGYIYSGHNDDDPDNALAADTDDNNGYFGTNNSSSDATTANGMIGKSQRRTLTLSNGNVIWDLTGNINEWTAGQTNGTTAQQPGIAGGGSGWREWTAITANGSLVVNPSPSGTGISGASNWNSSNGIGQIYSSTDETALHGFVRGGAWGYGSHDGILTIDFSYAPGNSYANFGFRVTR